ncbi:hypothetical protein BDW74DRAFT_177701 [Aspergillus multicolor]|uniref:heme-dependent oxidative N-demethylase family protein n=1 Tax=Aspergillus multicolor TaxID=41759 RepID=UPI003CCDEDB0
MAVPMPFFLDARQGLAGYSFSGLGLFFVLLTLASTFLLKLYLNLHRKPEVPFVTDPKAFKYQFPPSPRQALLDDPNPNPTAKKYRDLLRAVEQGPKVKGATTATGFSIADIEALGRFPDYSVLSGVPHPKPCPEFDIKTACFRPYRPFRWKYHQTMALSKYEPDFWIELEQNYFSSLEQRKALLSEHGTNILNYAPGSDLACRELMEMVLQNICIRYPAQFRLNESKTILTNNLLRTKTDLTTTHPLHVLFANIPEDFAIMIRDPKTGIYHLDAGYICSSIGWTFGTHFRRPLWAIHTEVNDYEKMAKSMDRYFSKMPVNAPIQRGAWFVEDWKPLFVTPEEYARNAGIRHSGDTKPVPIEECFLRVDWQTLRRLPLSGAIVFNFKAIFTPLTELKDEPYAPALLYKQVTEGRRKITEPKVHKHLLAVVLGALEEWKREQVEKGLVVERWEEETLRESPFYPGWEKRWKERIGFEI